MGNFKKAALLVLLSKKVKERNGNPKAITDFVIKLDNGQSIYVSRGQDIAIRSDRIGIGTKAFEDSDDDNLLIKLVKVFANDKVSDFNYVDLEDISTIV